MSFAKFLKKRQKLKENEYISAKFFFVLSSFLFFGSYYLLGVSYNEEIMKQIIPFFLLFFILSGSFYLISLVSVEIEKKPIKIILYVLISLIGLGFIGVLFLRDLILSII